MHTSRTSFDRLVHKFLQVFLNVVNRAANEDKIRVEERLSELEGVIRLL